DNALLRIDDLEVAGELCERFAHRAWPRLLDVLARRVNIHLPAIAGAEGGSYYWCLDQAEVATDVMFRDRRSLTAVLPDLVRHASLNMSSVDVLRFLGRKLHPSLRAEVITDTKGRPEGWRVKHRRRQHGHVRRLDQLRQLPPYHRYLLSSRSAPEYPITKTAPISA